MKWISTRRASPAITVSEAMQRGLAPDGGLYVPESFPSFDPDEFGGEEEFSEIASRLLWPFFEGDPLQASLHEICEEAFDFPIVLKDLKPGFSVLELFHGPTSAFKDVGARFLASALERIGSEPRTILVATSGDTGGAVAAAFFRKSRANVIILYPKGAVSARQEKQLTCWGENVQAFSVRGTFDECQRLVKAALNDAELRKKLNLSSANSINAGRLLPQMAYYAAASIWYRYRHGAAPSFAIPSGNVGNSLGALWAKKIGFAIDQIVMVTNANRTVPDYFETQKWKPRPSVTTLANAMDVGDPSNMERVFDLYQKDHSALSRDVSSVSVDDDTIRKTIASGMKKWGEIWCPHTATAVSFCEKQKSSNWIIVSTAHPAKFETIVEPLIGQSVAIPPSLAALLGRKSQHAELSTDYAEFKSKLAP